MPQDKYRLFHKTKLFGIEPVKKLGEISQVKMFNPYLSHTTLTLNLLYEIIKKNIYNFCVKHLINKQHSNIFKI